MDSNNRQIFPFWPLLDADVEVVMVLLIRGTKLFASEKLHLAFKWAEADGLSASA